MRARGPESRQGSLCVVAGDRETIEELPRRQDLDPLHRAERKQVTVPGHDDAGFADERRLDELVVIRILRHPARHPPLGTG